MRTRAAPQESSVLWTRIATAAVGVPLALVVIWVGGWALTVAIAVVALVGLREYQRMFGRNGRIDVWGDAALALGAVFWASRNPAYGYCEYTTIWACGGILVTILFHRLWVRRVEPSLRSYLLESQFVAVPYTAVLFGYTLLLRSLAPGAVRHTPVPLGAALLFLAIGACWVTDAAAYLVGRKIGKHKLAPKISPGKTVEGSVAGLLGAVLFVGALGWWVGLPVWSAALLGVTLGVVGQLGDLFESWLKRRAGVKDSGALLPGHGGVLDRFDSLLFVAPVAYYWLRAVLAG
jgi:phosphatidate cytidylyltransferase